jgi:[ribosomal protein S18]-alanine N-acetyltransferase
MSAAFESETTVRQMQPSDLRVVAQVEIASYEFPWSYGIFRDCLLAGYHCLVLEIDGVISGYAIMSVAAGEAHILNLCIHPDVRRFGNGRRLLNSLLFRAAEIEVAQVFLEVRPSNVAALSLYRSLGFERIGMRPDYYQAIHGREDAVVLALDLKSRR